MVLDMIDRRGEAAAVSGIAEGSNTTTRVMSQRIAFSLSPPTPINSAA
jgi:hypothetical protein